MEAFFDVAGYNTWSAASYMSDFNGSVNQQTI